MGIRHRVMNGGGKILDLHAAHHDRVEIGQRRFDHAVGGVKRHGLGTAAHVDGEVAGKRVGRLLGSDFYDSTFLPP